MVFRFPYSNRDLLHEQLNQLVCVTAGACLRALETWPSAVVSSKATGTRGTAPTNDASIATAGADGLRTPVCVTLVCMAQVDRFSVTMPPEIGAAVRDAATRQGTSVSNWLAAAASQRLRNELLGAALDIWEAEDGPFSDKELDAAAAALGGKRRRGAA